MLRLHFLGMKGRAEIQSEVDGMSDCSNNRMEVQWLTQDLSLLRDGFQMMTLMSLKLA